MLEWCTVDCFQNVEVFTMSSSQSKNINLKYFALAEFAAAAACRFDVLNDSPAFRV